MILSGYFNSLRKQTFIFCFSENLYTDFWPYKDVHQVESLLSYSFYNLSQRHMH